MSQSIKLKKGFDINLSGKAEKKLIDIPQPEIFAFKPTDFHGISRPKLLVKEGDNVKAGTPLMFDKISERVMFSAPVSGEIVEIVRGEKRKLLAVKILADKEVEFESYKSYSVSDLVGISKEDAIEQMVGSGVWPNIIQRPFGVVANPEDTPKAIFISTFDSSPLAPDYSFVLNGDDQNFQAGVDILKKLTTGAVHLNVSSNHEIAKVFNDARGVQINKFSGPHPAGNVGVQIHHLDPINKGEVVWTVNPVGVAQIGKLFLEGKYDTSRLIAITGSELKETGYIKTYLGAPIAKLTEGKVANDHARYISGNVLTGEGVGADGFVGFNHYQVTVIPEGDHHEFLGWILPSTKKLSFHKAFGLLSFLNGKNHEYVVDTNTQGEKRAFVQTGSFEKVVPMDILPTHLIKSILADDFDEMEALGIYELIEEDLALCEFIDVSKHDIQGILRQGLDAIKES